MELRPVSPADRRRIRLAVNVTALFLLATLAQGCARADYDAWHQAVSALSLGPTGWVQDLAFMLLGLAIVATVPAWRRILAGGKGATAYPVLLALTGSSLMAVGFFPQDPAPGYDPEMLGRTLPTATGLIHLALAGVAASSSAASLFVMASRFSTTPGWNRWSFPTRVAGALTVACVIVYAVWSVQPAGFAGTFERLVIVIPAVWGFALVRSFDQGRPFVLASVRAP